MTKKMKAAQTSKPGGAALTKRSHFAKCGHDFSPSGPSRPGTGGAVDIRSPRRLLVPIRHQPQRGGACRYQISPASPSII